MSDRTRITLKHRPGFVLGRTLGDILETKPPIPALAAPPVTADNLQAEIERLKKQVEFLKRQLVRRATHDTATTRDDEKPREGKGFIPKAVIARLLPWRKVNKQGQVINEKPEIRE